MPGSVEEISSGDEMSTNDVNNDDSLAAETEILRDEEMVENISSEIAVAADESLIEETTDEQEERLLQDSGDEGKGNNDDLYNSDSSSVQEIVEESSICEDNSSKVADLEEENPIKMNESKLQEDEDEDDDDVVEIEEKDPLGDGGDEVQQEVELLSSGDEKDDENIEKKKNVSEEGEDKDSSSGSKKEPTLVIIDTNSILSGKGPVKVSGKMEDFKSPPTIPSINIPDDAFLIEAPSFIVPYVFEQSGEKLLKAYVKDLGEEVKKEKKNEGVIVTDAPEDSKKKEDYFESPVGKLLCNLGMSLVQEYVQVDLLKQQRRKADKEKAKNRLGKVSIQTQQSIISLKNNIEESKENNEPFRFPVQKCRNCNFKTESNLVMSTHLETPHMRNNCYRCNFCKFTTKLPDAILLHMEQDHEVRSRLERAPAVHQCSHCAFEDHSKAKLTRHIVGCTKRFRIEDNCKPPLDWDTPAKLPKVPKNRIMGGNFNMSGNFANSAFSSQLLQQPMRNSVQYPTMSSMSNKYMQQGTRTQLPPLLQAPKAKPLPGLIRTHPNLLSQPAKMNNLNRSGMVMRPTTGQVIGQPQLIHQIGNNNTTPFLSKLSMLSNQAHQSPQRLSASQLGRPKGSAQQQPSISITPLPRQTMPATAIASQHKPQGKTSFVICEICDGYIKDLDQLRNHMQWIHKVKIHPKMIYNKPPLNCQKCQFRFFTDQGLERHLLGSHGLVTSSMQEAANKGQDCGRCPLCGKVYQWKLLSHVAKDHNVTLKPAHLSYKCTVCTATFGMYKLFENHVYSAHSMSGKNKTSSPAARATSSQNKVSSATATRPTASQGFKPMKINDEITIIPQPLANSQPIRNKGSLTITPHSSAALGARRAMRTNGGIDEGIEIIEIDDAPNNGRSANGGDYNSRHSNNNNNNNTAIRNKRQLEISVCGTDSDNSDDSYQRALPPQKRLRGN